MIQKRYIRYLLNKVNGNSSDNEVESINYSESIESTPTKSISLRRLDSIAWQEFEYVYKQMVDQKKHPVPDSTEKLEDIVYKIGLTYTKKIILNNLNS